MSFGAWFQSLIGRLAPKPPEKPTTGGAGATDSWAPVRETMPLGIRNKNPGNVRPLPGGQYWRGQVGTHKGFCVFESDHYGIRACALVLRNYQRLHGINTVRGIINRYAPSEDRNDVNAYIAHVCEQTGWRPDEYLNLQAEGTLVALVRAVIKHENGVMPYSTVVLAGGVKDALGAK